jgi:hypothetical protein
VSDKPENPPAFPRTDDAWWGGEQGMTLRDYFAGQISPVGAPVDHPLLARRLAIMTEKLVAAYQMADANAEGA